MTTVFALIALSFSSVGSVFKLTFIWRLFASDLGVDIFSLTHVELSLKKEFLLRTDPIRWKENNTYIERFSDSLLLWGKYSFCQVWLSL